MTSVFHAFFRSRTVLTVIASAGLAMQADGAMACQIPASPGDQSIPVPAEIFVPAQLAIGQRIGDGYYSTPVYSASGPPCNSWVSNRFYTKPLTLWRDHIYQTNIPGIGIKVHKLDKGKIHGAVPTDFVSTQWTMNATENGYYVEFYKTARVISGSLESGRYVEHRLNGHYLTSLGLPEIRFVGGDPTCDLGELSDVDLGQIPASRFDGPGTSTDWTGFTLDASACYHVDTISMTFSGAASPADATLFDNSGTARGVAIELQSADGQPAIPNAQDPVTFNASADAASYGLRTRVKQVDAQVLSGDISSAITANITYN